MEREVVVGGGGTELARAVALGFARGGDRVLVLGDGGGEVAGMADELTGQLDAGVGRVDWYEADLAAPADVARLAADRFGGGQRVDVLVSSPYDPTGGGAPGLPLGADGAGLAVQDRLELLAAEWGRAFRAAVLPAVLLTEALADALRPGGRVVLVSSAGAAATDGGAACAAATAALRGWAERLAGTLGPTGVTVNVVAVGAPGPAVETQAADAPDGVVAAVTYLASPAAAAMTGQVLHVHGG